MIVIVKSHLDGTVMMTVENSKELDGKTVEQLGQMKSEVFNEEGVLIGYVWSGYMFDQDIDFEIA